MTVLEVFERFPDQEACIKHLEKVCWGDTPCCPHCESEHVGPKNESNKVGRWNCYDCKSSFNALSKTIFQKTKVDLRKWFAMIVLLLNAKKSISSHQLARDLGLNKATAWFMAHRIRRAMQERDVLLKGIVEADETFVGARAKRQPDKELRTKRGVEKMTYLGAVEREREGRVAVRIADGVTKPRDKKLIDLIPKFILDCVDKSNVKLVSDGFSAYNPLGEIMPHYTAKHKEEEPLTTDIDVHTNTIEGFWTWIKRAWYGTHHRYTRKYAPLYIAEATFKYNNRKDIDLFGSFPRRCLPMQL